MTTNLYSAGFSAENTDSNKSILEKAGVKEPYIGYAIEASDIFTRAIGNTADIYLLSRLTPEQYQESLLLLQDYGTKYNDYVRIRIFLLYATDITLWIKSEKEAEDIFQRVKNSAAFTKWIQSINWEYFFSVFLHYELSKEYLKLILDISDYHDYLIFNDEHNYHVGFKPVSWFWECSTQQRNFVNPEIIAKLKVHSEDYFYLCKPLRKYIEKCDLESSEFSENLQSPPLLKKDLTRPKNTNAQKSKEKSSGKAIRSIQPQELSTEINDLATDFFSENLFMILEKTRINPIHENIHILSKYNEGVRDVLHFICEAVKIFRENISENACRNIHSEVTEWMESNYSDSIEWYSVKFPHRLIHGKTSKEQFENYSELLNIFPIIATISYFIGIIKEKNTFKTTYYMLYYLHGTLKNQSPEEIYENTHIPGTDIREYEFWRVILGREKLQKFFLNEILKFTNEDNFKKAYLIFLNYLISSGRENFYGLQSIRTADSIFKADKFDTFLISDALPDDPYFFFSKEFINEIEHLYENQSANPFIESMHTFLYFHQNGFHTGAKEAMNYIGVLKNRLIEMRKSLHKKDPDSEIQFMVLELNSLMLIKLKFEWELLKHLLLTFRILQDNIIEKNLTLNYDTDNIPSAALTITIESFFQDLKRSHTDLGETIRKELFEFLIDKCKPTKKSKDPSFSAKEIPGDIPEEFRNGWNTSKKEPHPVWREAYIRAAGQLGVNPGGKGHYALQKIASDENETEDIRKAADKTAQKINSYRKGIIEGSSKRFLLNAWWVLRYAYCVSNHFEVNEQEALITRSREVRI